MSKFLPFNLFIRQALLYPLTSPFLPPIDKVELDYSYGAGKLIGTLEPGGAAGLPKTGQETSYADYDDGWFEKGLPETGARFTDNADGTITDNATGLMWAKDGNAAGCNNGSTINWATSLTYANGLTFATYSDWRVPNIKELESIMLYEGATRSVDPTFFTNTKAGAYWSSTTTDGLTTYAWIQDFAGSTKNVTAKTGLKYLRLVRLGVPA